MILSTPDILSTDAAPEQTNRISPEAAVGPEAGGPSRSVVRRGHVIDDAREFGIDELFFSMTDLKGIIQAGNEIFVRLSGFSWPELNRTAHSIVRHPDMPRAVFQLMWDTIGAGRPLVAYVKNRAKDGRYYWVVALVLPTPNGYLSVRFKPSSQLFPAVRQLYSELRQVEMAVENSGGSRKAAIAAGAEALSQKLQSLEFADYDQFMRRFLQQELRSRDAALAGAMGHSQARSGSNLTSSCSDALVILRNLFADLDSYAQLTARIRTKQQAALILSDAVGYLSLNAALEATRLGRSGAALSPIFDWLGGASRETTKSSHVLSEQLSELASQTEFAIFYLGAARLQIEMIDSFAREISLLDRSERDSDLRKRDTESVRALIRAFDNTLRTALGSLQDVRSRLSGLNRAQDHVAAATRTLKFTYMAGKVEVARLPDRDCLEKMFLQLGERLRGSEADMRDLKEAVFQLDLELSSALAKGLALQRALSLMEEAAS